MPRLKHLKSAKERCIAGKVFIKAKEFCSASLRSQETTLRFVRVATLVLALNPQSTKPKNPRVSKLATYEFKKEIKEIREKYPNLGKERIYYLLKPKARFKTSSISAIGKN